MFIKDARGMESTAAYLSVVSIVAPALSEKVVILTFPNKMTQLTTLAIVAEMTRIRLFLGRKEAITDQKDVSGIGMDSLEFSIRGSVAKTVDGVFDDFLSDKTHLGAATLFQRLGPEVSFHKSFATLKKQRAFSGSTHGHNWRQPAVFGSNLV